MQCWQNLTLCKSTFISSKIKVIFAIVCAFPGKKYKNNVSYTVLRKSSSNSITLEMKSHCWLNYTSNKPDTDTLTTTSTDNVYQYETFESIAMLCSVSWPVK